MTDADDEALLCELRRLFALTDPPPVQPPTDTADPPAAGPFGSPFGVRPTNPFSDPVSGGQQPRRQRGQAGSDHAGGSHAGRAHGADRQPRGQ